MSQRILVTSALPYANGPSHIGRLTGAYLPADIYVRYQRLQGRDVLYVCGSDEHGVPITIQAEKEGLTPQELVDRYTAMIQDEFSRMGISFDFYSRTSKPIHHETARDVFLDLLGKRLLKQKPEMQWYDEKAGMFLSDRYVEGTCPVCQNPEARGDQCEQCGTYLNQMDLKNPRSKVTGATPVARETTHFYLPMGLFQEALEKWISTKTHWKDNVINYCRGWFAQKLGDRAITRDIDWGVKVPTEDAQGRKVAGAERKVIYVWFEAVLGYISATKDWARSIGRPDAWKDYWMQDDTQLVHFIGKDNIVFHAIMFPIITMAYNQGKTSDRLVMVSDVPACEFLNLEGAKLSTSRNYAVWVKDYLKKFPPDPLRYTLTCNLPETKDSDFSWKDFQAKNNNELADILGNFINRTLAFVDRHFQNCVPEVGALMPTDRAMRDEISITRDRVAQSLENFKFRDACRHWMDLARFANKYFNDSEPWKTVKTDRARCGTTLNVSVQVIAALAVAMFPFLPFTSERLWSMLGLSGSPSQARWADIGAREIPVGHALGKAEILFVKIEDVQIQPEIEQLQSTVQEKKSAEDISIDDFKKLDLRAARVVQAEKVKGSDKLLRLEVDLGSERRQIVSGLAAHYAPESLIGRQVIVIANLKPAKIRGVESRGMLLTAGDDSNLKILTPEGDVPNGAKIA